jgi:hypothetical protein
MDVKPFSMSDTVFDPTMTSSPSPSKSHFLFEFIFTTISGLGYWPPTPAMPYGSTNHSYSPMASHYYSTYGSPPNTSIYPNYPLSYSPYPTFY